MSLESSAVHNPPDSEIADLLRAAKTIAVVGVSHKEDRDSNRIARYLIRNGYTVIPVNPKYKEVLGLRCHPNLAAVPDHIDIVDIFRNVEAIPGVVDEAVAVRAGAVWMQLGLAHEGAARTARAAGLVVIQDRCIGIDHSRLVEGGGRA